MNTPLYKLADEYLAIAQLLADHELPEEVIADTLEGASGDLEEKAWNVAALIQQSEGEAAMIKDAEQRMSQRRKSLERRIDWLRQYLLVQLLRTGITEIDRRSKSRKPSSRSARTKSASGCSMAKQCLVPTSNATSDWSSSKPHKRPRPLPMAARELL